MLVLINITKSKRPVDFEKVINIVAVRDTVLLSNVAIINIKAVKIYIRILFLSIKYNLSVSILIKKKV